MKLTTAILMAGTSCSSATAGLWLTPMQAACDKFGASTPQRVAALLANIGVESAGFTQLAENLNYSAQGLANTWARYSSTGVKGGPPNALANSLARNPQAIANDVYANRLGNGDPASGDGWKFRGQGPIQLTGRDVILAFLAAAGLPLYTDPTLLQQPIEGSESAVWFFGTYKNCFVYADAGNFDMTVTRVNGQAPCDANNGTQRRTSYRNCLAAIAA